MDEGKVQEYVLGRIRYFRERDRNGVLRGKRFTQARLGHAIGVSRTTVANLENARQQLTVSMLLRIAEVLDVPPVMLLPELDEVKLSDLPTVSVGGERLYLPQEERSIANRIEELRRRKGQEGSQ